MLGEDHSLIKDFSAHKDKIIKLTASDSSFKKMANEYHRLDSEIREIELQGVPVADERFNQLKHQRSALKDKLYKLIIH
ncbi:DUF465 domain-containing protein [Parashewanella spongiae]|uniref:DUF465 domain-containing protein n=1 Tax=Parashewanella spongiae TaxID=342950 RepID=A0A3A6SZN9_9GAMM|nr:YdcH family protein [Parashewanella spongiae]MCL1080318.1 YdcH family protein [Parashewanella spongiae]RJY00944.1 DUF465 domain-containing protein [Parashewanella spongiae]